MSGINPSRASLLEALYGGSIQIKPQGFWVGIEDDLFGSGGIGPMEVKMVCGQKSNPPVPGYSGHILVPSKYSGGYLANHTPSRLPRQ